MRNRNLVTLVTLALAIVVLGSGMALADDLNVGGNFNMIPLSSGDEGGGSITTSYLNGGQLSWLYCVDLNHTITVPGDYNNTATTSNGMVNGGLVNNAGQVAWLLDHYATADIGDKTGQVALQAAIWHEIYGVGLNPGSSYYTLAIQADYTAYITGVGSDPLANVKWFSPGIQGDPTVYQGLVGPGVPDSGVTLLLLGGALVGLETLRRRLHA